jgi:hypothetical protein
MKKNLFTLSALSISVMAIVFLLVMCKRDCENCEPLKPDAIENITFNLVSQSQTCEFEIRKFNEHGYYRESCFRVPDEKLFKYVKEYCISRNILVDNQSFAFILYYDLAVSPTQIVTDEHIKGISLYQETGRKIMHHLYVKNYNSEFYEIKNVNVAVPYISPLCFLS